ncbi:hypothetical protein [Cellulosimicrobium cellulans]|uniref:hypothetical protein n=1 Tax=Cellulosimicrobium cellulans TaxID=1710 RepID=UPI003C3B3EF4
MKHAGATTAIIATLALTAACTTAGEPENEPTTTATSSEATQEPTTDTPTQDAPTVTPAPEPTNEDGIDLAANYPDADTEGFTTQYRAITHDADTPDGEVAMGGYQLCYDMDIQGPQAIIDQGAQALMQAGAPTQQDALNISSLIAYAAAKHVCPWNEQYVLEIIQTQ